ncbi:MAG: hypothetical protein H6753_03950 [Candidatus Omnitrophica bacterium]|nr:hypothetical protein [Candidatus Omnitrophota bacterium]
MKIHIPNSVWLGNINPFLASFDPSDPDSLDLTVNEKWFSVHPVVLAMIASVGVNVDASRIRCAKLEAKSRYYLQRMGLFHALKIDGGMDDITEHEPAGRFIPLTQIHTADDLSSFVANMIPLLHLPAEHAKTIGYIMSELGRNVIEHARTSEGAFLCAQYYQKSNTIRIGIADTGIGIKEAISQSHSVSTDAEAIRLALTPGITGVTSREGGNDVNAGAGLFFIKSIAQANRDFFILYSGSTLYKLLKRTSSSRLRLFADPFKDRHSLQTDLPYWQGTMVGIDINLDDTKEFILLLDAIHEVYIKAIQERKKARYKKAKFV